MVAGTSTASGAGGFLAAPTSAQSTRPTSTINGQRRRSLGYERLAGPYVAAAVQRSLEMADV